MSNHSFQGERCDGHMGLMASYRWKHDPKTILFVLARYKWVSKMLAGKREVLEIGCGDGFGSRLVAETVKHLDCFDQDKEMVESAAPHPNISFHDGTFWTEHDYDAAFALDVVEHMTRAEMRDLLGNMSRTPVVIIGSPSLESQEHASPLSKQNHINCMTSDHLKAEMAMHFRHVFMFSMNDEIVGTGFGPMSHYNFALGVN